MTETFTLAHFSDVHMSPISGFGWRYWNVKRVLGYLNWQYKRRHVHFTTVADRLIADAHALRPDHIAITGDLVNLGLPAEHDAALAWLRRVGSPDHVTVIPGNHDIYSSMRGDRGVARWAAYMGSEEDTLAFPFVRRVGPLALVGLNSAVETPPFFASGLLGAHQLEIAQEQLLGLDEEGAIRVVLIHHPPLADMTASRRRLKDAAHFAHLLERTGAELVLYGHNHIPAVDWLPSRGKPVPLIAAASASAGTAYGKEPLARYNLFTFFRNPSGLRIRHVVRGLETPDGPVTKISENFLETDD
ncbi:metallophosphoesterase [Hyphomicrobium denitrificans 1NES1]|uniref:Metallophosphoesterase n=1 Tax=Hyphomicrobium denitrificans 1NES1 TaxID=670307 RepID=N0B919_9HYPH|nr:metallophosphoesterase [Hyphomicrobium denitrificans]AGK58787.1 metallophosphoesterase [Hyphomicrobium denitrificans 1NES1]